MGEAHKSAVRDTEVISLDFEDYPFEASKADHACDLCGAENSYLDEVIINDQGGRIFVCSDTDFCTSRQDQTKEEAA